MGPGTFPAGRGAKLTPLTHPSPNFGPRKAGARPSLVVIHYTAMNTADAACDRLCDPAAEVSAHYLIEKGGGLRTLVREEDRAWHAGAGRWGDITDVNSHSIGIELDNDGQCTFDTHLMHRLCTLLAGILARHRIPPERVIGHSDMALTRKSDPGALFDWAQLARHGLAIAPDPSAFRRQTRVSATAFYTDLAMIGYDPAAPREAQLTAFRLRFHPGGTGELSALDAQIARDIANRFPVDRRLR